MATIRSRIAKGRAFQKKVMLMFKETFNLSNDEVRAPVGSETGDDVKFSEDTQKLLGISIECKNVRAMTDMFGALEQCMYNAKRGEKKLKCKLEPVLVVHKSKGGNRKTWATMDLDHYLDIRKRLLEHEQGNLDINK